MPGTNLNNLDAYNEVATTLGGAGGDLNDIDTVNAIAILEGAAGGHLNMINALNAIDVDAGGPGGHLNTLDALNSIVVQKGGVGGHENDLDAINEWIDFAAVSFPLDLVSGAEAAYSIARRLSSTSWGTVDSVLDPMVRLREDGGDTEQTFSYNANNDLDTVAVETFRAGANLFVTKLYDHTGNGHDLVQTTDGIQPPYVASGIGGKPTMQFVEATDHYLDLVVSTSTTVALHVYVIANFVSLVFETFIAHQNALRSLFRVDDADTYFLEASSFDITETLLTGVDYLLGMSRDVSDNMSGYLDGVDVTDGSPTNSTVAGLGGLGSRKGGGSLSHNGEMSEVLYYQVEHSTADQTLLNDDLKAFYSI